MSFGLGSTAYNILTQLRDINANYQTYFDQEGIFGLIKFLVVIMNKIMIDDEIWNKVLISYKKSTDFESVKNYIEVFGKTQDKYYYSEEPMEKKIIILLMWLMIIIPKVHFMLDKNMENRIKNCFNRWRI